MWNNKQRMSSLSSSLAALFLFTLPLAATGLPRFSPSLPYHNYGRSIRSAPSNTIRYVDMPRGVGNPSGNSPLLNLQRIREAQGEDEGAEYNSYEKFNLNNLEENSSAWKVAMINFLLDMKKNGHRINELNSSLERAGHGSGELTATATADGEPVICKMEPFNICYRMNGQGDIVAAGGHRPVRMMRIYKRSGRN